MPKHLILVRHAKATKAAQRTAALADAERPLTKRGRSDARAVGRYLATRDFQPDLIWSSPARRALDTSRIVAKQLGYRRRHIQLDERLYATTAAALLRLIRGLNRDLSRVLLCGHNPELRSVANRLGARLERLPTSGLVQLKFGVRDWSRAGAATLVQVRFERPSKS